MIAELYRRGAKDIAVVGRSLEKMKVLANEFPQARFIYLQGDVSSLEDIKSLSNAVQHVWGKLDI